MFNPSLIWIQKIIWPHDYLFKRHSNKHFVKCQHFTKYTIDRICITWNNLFLQIRFTFVSSGPVCQNPTRSQPISREMYIFLLRKCNMKSRLPPVPSAYVQSNLRVVYKKTIKNHSEITFSMKRVGISQVVRKYEPPYVL